MGMLFIRNNRFLDGVKGLGGTVRKYAGICLAVCDDRVLIQSVTGDIFPQP